MTFTAGKLALAAIVAAVLAGLLPVFWLGLETGLKTLDGYSWHVIAFTLEQAALSTLLSAVLGVCSGLALARRKFPGRSLLVGLLALPLALPALVVVLGLVAIFGADGVLSGTIPLYGLSGILLAHVFFNAPLVARYTLSALDSVPFEQHRLAAQLGLRGRQYFRLIDWPALRRILPGTLMLVFLLCAASFTIVLTLGGGPRATTLEVAIYQALRADFDIARATQLALVQIALCAGLGFAVMRFGGTMEAQSVLRLQNKRYDGHSSLSRTVDFTSLLLMSALLVPPLAALAVSGLEGFAVNKALLTATIWSAGLTLASSLLAVALAWALASWAARSSLAARPAALASQLGFIAPPAVIATGWTILAIHGPGLTSASLSLIIALNALMALPFAFGALAAGWASHAASYGRLCASLGIGGWNKFRLIDISALKAPLVLALAMAAVLSLGDLSAVLFFGQGRIVTLPALIYQQMSSYRMEGAMGTALLLAVVSFALLWLGSIWSKRHA